MRRVSWPVRAVALGVSFVALAAPAAHVPEPLPPAQRARAAVEEAALAARKTAVCRDIVMRALENALAVQNEVETDVQEALLSGKKDRIADTRTALREATGETEEALDLVEQVVDWAGRASAAADAASHALRALEAGKASAKASEESARAAQKMAAEARRALAQATALTETLKKKWLLPNLPPPAGAAKTSP